MLAGGQPQREDAGVHVVPRWDMASLPAATDAIADTLDYKAVSKRLIEYVSASEFGLVETLAERCAEIVLQEFGVRRLRLKLAKPGAVRGAKSVGVIIERGAGA